MFNCSMCGREYKFKKSLYRHERENHNTIVIRSKDVICKLCHKPFKKKIELLTHMQEHRTRVRHSRLLCAVKGCQEKFRTYSNLHNHLLGDHSLELLVENHDFAEMKDFDLWRKDVERKFNASYVRDTKPKQLKNGSRLYYFCNRFYSAKFKARSAEGCSPTQIGRVCPSRIIATVYNEGVSVTFYPDHIGHLIFSNADVNQAADLDVVSELDIVEQEEAVETPMKDSSMSPENEMTEVTVDSPQGNQDDVFNSNDAIASKFQKLLALNKEVAIADEDRLLVIEHLNEVINIYNKNEIR